MRAITRLLVFVCKATIVVFGFVLSFFLAFLLDPGGRPLLFFLGFFCGLLATAIALMLVRHRTWQRNIERDVAHWTRCKTLSRLHPIRARYQRLAVGIVVWVPSAVAIVVLFFFPVATHWVHPSSQYVKSYRIPIPWTYTVFPSAGDYDSVDVIFSSSGSGRFGVTPFPMPPLWMYGQPVSFITFGAQPNALGPEVLRAERKEFRAEDFPLTCWQHRPRYHSHTWPGAWFVWSVTCEASAPLQGEYFYGRFAGREEDLPAFYHIIERVQPVK